MRERQQRVSIFLIEFMHHTKMMILMQQLTGFKQMNVLVSSAGRCQSSATIGGAVQSCIAEKSKGIGTIYLNSHGLVIRTVLLFWQGTCWKFWWWQRTSRTCIGWTDRLTGTCSKVPLPKSAVKNVQINKFWSQGLYIPSLGGLAQKRTKNQEPVPEDQNIMEFGAEHGVPYGTGHIEGHDFITSEIISEI